MKPHDKTAQILDDLLGLGSSPSPPTSPTTQTNELSPPPSIDVPPPSNEEQCTETISQESVPAVDSQESVPTVESQESVLVNRKRRKLDKLSESEGSPSSRSDSGSESSEQSSPQGRTCRRKNGTAAVKNDILNKKKKSRKSYNKTPPTSGSESSEGFKPSEEDQSDSSVSEPLAESSEEEVKKRKKKAPASRKPRKAVSEESSHESNSGSWSDASERLAKRRRAKPRPIEESESEDEEQLSETSSPAKTPKRKKRTHKVFSPKITPNLDRSRVLDEIESYSGNLKKQASSKFNKYETSYYRDHGQHEIDEYDDGTEFVVEESESSGEEEKTKRKRKIVNVLQDDESDEEAICGKVSPKPSSDKSAQSTTPQRRSSRGIKNPTRRLDKPLEKLKDARKSGVTKVRKRLLTEDEDEEVGSDMQEMVDSTPVKQYTRQQEGFRDFIGYTQQHNDNAEVDSEDEMRPTLSGRRSCILPDSQESNGGSDVAGEDLSVETDLVKTKEETAELTHGLQSNGKALEDAAERTEDSIKDKEEEQSEDEKETDPVLICLRSGTVEEFDSLVADQDLAELYPDLLHSAAGYGDVDKLEHILMYHSQHFPPGDVWKKDSVKRWMPLSHAVHGNHPDMVETLLNQMNDPSSQSSKKEKLLSRTIDELCKRCCEVLVKGDISCLVTITEFDEEAGTESCLDLILKEQRGQRIMLQTMSRECNVAALNFLINQEVRLSTLDHVHLLVTECLESERWKEDNEVTPLASPKMEEWLEEKGKRSKGEVFLKTVLLNYGEDLAPLLEEQGDDECTPLMVASAAGRSQAVNLFLEHGALITACDSNNTRCLHLAAMNGHVETVRTLLLHKVTVYCEDSHGWSPLMYAVFKDQWDIVDELMSLNLSKHSSVLLQSLLAMINRQYRAKERELKHKNFDMSMKLIEHVAHKDLYREQLNSFFEKCDTKLINDKTFYDLFAMPGLINMKIKKKWLASQLTLGYSGHNPTIRRDHLVEDMYKSVGVASGAIRGIRWDGEAGSGPGPTKEFFSCIGPALVKEKYFVSSAEGVLSLPCRVYCSQRNNTPLGNTLKIYEMVGGMIARSVIQNKVITLPLPDHIFNYILGNSRNVLKDFQAVSKAEYTSINSVEDFASLEIPFAIDLPDVVNGGMLAVPLKPGPVEEALQCTETATNKKGYLVLLARTKLYDLCRQELSALKKGFSSMFSPKLHRFISGRELSLLVCGDSELDLADWQRHTEYTGYTADSVQIVQFWRIIGNMTTEDRLSLLHFTTGNSALPLEGFGGLTSKFKVSKSWNAEDSLPTAATCFNSIRLPKYSSEEIMKEKLLIAVRFGSCGFSFG